MLDQGGLREMDVNDSQDTGAEAAALEKELLPIAELCTGKVCYMSEGAHRYIHMNGLHFLAKGKEQHMDALLCLNYHNSTYPTKLYLPQNLGLGLNWNENAYIFARQWFTWSWRGVTPNQTPFEILAGHLEAFK